MCNFNNSILAKCMDNVITNKFYFCNFFKIRKCIRNMYILS